jgi:hypothetical protein
MSRAILPWETGRLFDYRQQQRQQHGRTAAVDDELLRGGAQVADAYERP